MTGRSRWGVIGAVALVALVFLLQGCLPAPVGDPQKSKVDEKYTGVWRSAANSSGESTLVIMHPWDVHTYYVTTQVVDKDWKPLPKAGQGHSKAWLTTLGGATFITIQPMDGLSFEYGPAADEKPFWVVERLDMKDGVVTARMVKPDSWIVKDLATSEKLEAAIKAQADNSELYAEAGTPYKKVPPEQAKMVQEALNNTSK